MAMLVCDYCGKELKPIYDEESKKLLGIGLRCYYEEKAQHFCSIKCFDTFDKNQKPKPIRHLSPEGWLDIVNKIDELIDAVNDLRDGKNQIVGLVAETKNVDTLKDARKIAEHFAEYLDNKIKEIYHGR